MQELKDCKATCAQAHDPSANKRPTLLLGLERIQDSLPKMKPKLVLPSPSQVQPQPGLVLRSLAPGLKREREDEQENFEDEEEEEERPSESDLEIRDNLSWKPISQDPKATPKRPRMFWTKEEVEKLKHDHNLFGNDWVAILENGKGTYLAERRTVDLKDK